MAKEQKLFEYDNEPTVKKKKPKPAMSFTQNPVNTNVFDGANQSKSALNPWVDASGAPIEPQLEPEESLKMTKKMIDAEADKPGGEGSHNLRDADYSEVYNNIGQLAKLYSGGLDPAEAKKTRDEFMEMAQNPEGMTMGQAIAIGLLQAVTTGVGAATGGMGGAAIGAKSGAQAGRDITGIFQAEADRKQKAAMFGAKAAQGDYEMALGQEEKMTDFQRDLFRDYLKSGYSETEAIRKALASREEFKYREDYKAARRPEKDDPKFTRIRKKMDRNREQIYNPARGRNIQKLQELRYLIARGLSAIEFLSAPPGSPHDWKPPQKETKEQMVERFDRLTTRNLGELVSILSDTMSRAGQGGEHRFKKMDPKFLQRTIGTLKEWIKSERVPSGGGDFVWEIFRTLQREDQVMGDIVGKTVHGLLSDPELKEYFPDEIAKIREEFGLGVRSFDTTKKSSPPATKQKQVGDTIVTPDGRTGVIKSIDENGKAQVEIME